MLNYIFAFCIVFAFVSAVISGNMAGLETGIIESAKDAVSLCIKISGMMLLWGGLMNIAEKSGLTNIIAKLFSPFLKRIFPKNKNDKDTMNAISMNVTANLLGLGNAATPLGIEAMKRLNANNPLKETASTEMIRFVVLNSAALHLIPTTVALLRSDAGSRNPLDILLPSLLTSICALTVGLTATYIFQFIFHKKNKNGR